MSAKRAFKGRSFASRQRLARRRAYLYQFATITGRVSGPWAESASRTNYGVPMSVALGGAS